MAGKKVWFWVLALAMFLVAGVAMAAEGPRSGLGPRLLLGLSGASGRAESGGPVHLLPSWLGKGFQPEDQPEDEDENPDDVEESWAPREGYGGGLGPVVQILTLDLSALDPMTRDRGLPAFDPQVILIGGQLGVVAQGAHVGMFGFGGSQDQFNLVDGHRREAEFGLGGGGVYLNYDFQILPGFGITASGLLGLGAIWFSAYGEDLDDPLHEAYGDDRYWAASAPFLMASPGIGLYVSPASIARIEVDYSYLFLKMDLDGFEYYNDFDQPMVDGQITGGSMLTVKVLFGSWP